MNSLVLTTYRPGRPSSGSALRNWQNIHALARLGPVDVVSVGVDGGTESVTGIREWATFSLGQRSAWDRLKTTGWLLRPGVHRTIDQYHMRPVTRWLEARVSQRAYGAAVVEGIPLSTYVQDLKRAGCRVVFDAHNVESALHAAVLDERDRNASAVRRAKDWVVRRRMSVAERRAVRGADIVWACSDGDARDLERLYGSREVVVVPNGVDVEAYRRPGVMHVHEDWTGHPITIVYTGLFSYQPNERAARSLVEDVLPWLRARGHDARVVLVGRGPSAAMLAAARLDNRVLVTGEVESVLPYLEQPCVVVVPITLGSGTRLKIVEAFAVGRPVVSTSKGAEGLDVVDGEHLLIRDDAASMAEAVRDLWLRPRWREALCGNALAAARRQYSWSSAARRIGESLAVAPRADLSSRRRVIA